MDIVVFFSWGTKLRHRGWNAGVCPYCQGLEAMRVEECIWHFSIYWLPVYSTSKGWAHRCDLCERLVASESVGPPIAIEAWIPADGLLPLLQRLGRTGNIVVRKAPIESRLNSLLSAAREATTLSSVSVGPGLALGAILGILLGIGGGLLAQQSRTFNVGLDALGTSMLGAMLGAAVGGVIGAVAYWLLRRKAIANRLIRSACRNYRIDPDQLAMLSPHYPAHVRNAVQEARLERLKPAHSR